MSNAHVTLLVLQEQTAAAAGTGRERRNGATGDKYSVNTGLILFVKKNQTKRKKRIETTRRIRHIIKTEMGIYVILAGTLLVSLFTEAGSNG